ncbi:hypothetical protein CN995_10175 [Bacillus cereus]|uniref:hypothetical protein n=1 Tax=Bacillus cereus TaxID=1396 RepID=UPI000BF7C12D|nr:hypothetical protein [Bacillus cereus]PFD01859.1 hypothetical protein CN289_20725 [Bacillus cereus]PFK65225.1 hypothetical protein COJ25_25930 [Bacillus cereus]PGO13650.1 hypothetical protein CN970_12020 [Bacillus cereus]PGP05896.1 hypothetical protein CN995_10175 [Bacillus cereus]
MLLNGKPEELTRYSKLKYDARLFIQKAHELWECIDLQIRCVYLISDLAKKGSGVFSIAYGTFQKMFTQRFSMEISLSTVRHFFALMEKIGLLSINEAKRKNEQQSANVYIVEQQCDEPQHEQPVEHPSEHQNTVSKETEDDKQKTLNNNNVNNTVIQNDVIHDESVYARKNGISKKMFSKVVDEMKDKKRISNIGAYIRGAINNIINHISFLSGTRTYENPMNQFFYDWLNSNGHETV